jgi:hypothetical protein
MKRWTVMVYMAADNDLESAAHSDLVEMLKVGSSEALDIVVQFDSREERTLRHHVLPKKLQPAEPPMGETNAGDPAVLAGFIKWARARYPAQHYLLVIWNHGTGWEDVRADFDWSSIRSSRQTRELDNAIFASTVRAAHARVAGARAVGLDATSRDFLDNEELRRGLSDGLAGDRLDVLGFDACLMGLVEIGYQLRDQACFMVASQELEPHYGWPYEGVLGGLRQNPEITPRELSRLIVRAYGEMGVRIRGATKYTQSALDLAQIGTTYKLVQALAGRLNADYPANLALRRAVHEACHSRRGAKRFRDKNVVDLYDWLWWLRRVYAGSDAGLTGAVDDLLAHLGPEADGGLVAANAAEVGEDKEHVHGVSIYLPGRRAYSPFYDDLDFSGSGWGEFARRVSETL